MRFKVRFKSHSCQIQVVMDPSAIGPIVAQSQCLVEQILRILVKQVYCTFPMSKPTIVNNNVTTCVQENQFLILITSSVRHIASSCLQKTPSCVFPLTITQNYIVINCVMVNHNMCESHVMDTI